MEEQLIETWLIHDRIHRYLLEAISEEALQAALSPKHRTVYALFAHIHNVRLMWIKSAMPDLLVGLEKIETKPPGTKAPLQTALSESGNAVAELLRRGIATGSIKGFKPHPVAFLGYLIAHESHHRGQIEWTLKQSGTPLDDRTSYGLWEWGVR